MYIVVYGYQLELGEKVRHPVLYRGCPPKNLETDMIFRKPRTLATSGKKME